MDAMLTVEEAAQTLRVTENTIRRWLRSGALRGFKLGRVWRISQRELVKLSEDGVTAGAIPPASQERHL